MLDAKRWPTVAAKYGWSTLDGGNLRSTVVRLSFPHLFTPTIYKKADGKADDAAKPRYACTLLMPAGDSASVLKSALFEIIKGQYGATCKIAEPTGGAKPTIRVDYTGKDGKPARANLDWPIVDQGEVLKEGYEGGSFYVAAYSQDKPAVVDAARSPITDANAIYAGAYAFVTIRPYWAKGWDRLSIALQGVQKLADGERFGGGAPAIEDQFEDVASDFGAMAADSAAGAASDLLN